ncbi:hypothetical protein K503DRAFT_720171 [Rhizopogon vinicolor AM-OR11-026]|uniref:G-protein coupled receptors family 1 profile domain-containing protein n=1 Tax=Rhizopogon vinicolor AM-OR11-026 TaxID=1314800 RepID=A0A1B7MX32_9AGAM|nr:hypothetical protein K503DRAFT_720171 [Rhizopogon vinicolor AM-OR11-026]
MVDWHDPGVISKCTTGFVDVTHISLGLYGWIYLQSLQVESALLRRQLPFRWPLISYLVGRIFLLVSLMLSAVLFGPFALHLDCDAALKFLAFSGNVAIACASTNLVIVSWSIWRNHRPVCLLLAFVTLGHWFTLTFDSWGSQVSSSWGSCGYLEVNPMYSAVAATYTLIFDFFLLKITILGLWRSSSSFSLRTVLYNHGIIYFFIVFLASFIPLIFSWLNLNYVMNIFFICPASCVMTIASSRALNPMIRTNMPLVQPRTPVVALPELGKESARVMTAESPEPSPVV